jgi:hypothetical protein
MYEKKFLAEGGRRCIIFFFFFTRVLYNTLASYVYASEYADFGEIPDKSAALVWHEAHVTYNWDSNNERAINATLPISMYNLPTHIAKFQSFPRAINASSTHLCINIYIWGGYVCVFVLCLFFLEKHSVDLYIQL